MDWFHFAVFGLALWRIVSLFTSERGPFKIFERIRETFGIQHDDNGDIVAIPDGNMGYLLTCAWCLSMVLALPYMVLVYFFQDVMFWLSLWPALSALAIIVGSLARR